MRADSSGSAREGFSGADLREESAGTLRDIKDRFIDADTVTSIHNITPKVGAMTIGIGRKDVHKLADCKNVVTRLQMEAAHYKT